MMPDVPVQVRRFLSVAKRQQLPFDESWEWALRRVVAPHSPKHREQYREVMIETRDAWRAAYHDEEVPGGRACLALAQTLLHEGNFAASSTSALSSSVPAEERREAA